MPAAEKIVSPQSPERCNDRGRFTQALGKLDPAAKRLLGVGVGIAAGGGNGEAETVLECEFLLVARHALGQRWDEVKPALVVAQRLGMGTTLTAATIVHDCLLVAQVGDSRAYLLRGDELVQVTRDQSLVTELVESGQLTEEEAFALLSLCVMSEEDLDAVSEKAIRKLADFCRAHGSDCNHSAPAPSELSEAG